MFTRAYNCGIVATRWGRPRLSEEKKLCRKKEEKERKLLLTPDT